MSEIEAQVGERFDVGLDAVPTSGFTWGVAALDEERVRLVSDEIEPTSEAIGGGAVQRFSFEALAPGEVELRFALSRPWESKPPAEERVVRVTIDG